MILSFINIRKDPREMLKTSGFAFGFQHLSRDLANVNEWKIMFDPYIIMPVRRHCSARNLSVQLKNSKASLTFICHDMIILHGLGCDCTDTFIGRW